MERPRLPLGDYEQLLLKNGLLYEGETLSADVTRPITAVTCDSRAVVPGSLFICKGAAFKVDYLKQALKQGAVAYVSERVYEVPAPCIRVKNIRTAMGLLADRAWGHPSGALKIAGITGTKGKTTTAYFIKSVLDLWREAEAKHPVGLLSTIVTDDGVQRRPAVLTTPEPLDLQRHLWNAVNAGCEFMVMEESSQALKYGRVIGVELEAAVFLNLGEDHISPMEHPDLEDYFQSKLKIFEQAKAAVINRDDPMFHRMLKKAEKTCKTILTYSISDETADIFAKDIHRNGDGMEFTARWMGEEQTLHIPMTGAFNVSDALAALGVFQILGVPAEYVRDGLSRARVPGRMETYQADGKSVIVDFAHNGMSLAALLRSVKADYPGQPLTVLFGCTGNKGIDRREGMAKAAGAYADRIILTEDDPGTEAVADICGDIGRYLQELGRTWTTIEDREEAVATAIRESASPGVVVLAGKGDETGQYRFGQWVPCVPDHMLVKKYLGLPLTT